MHSQTLQALRAEIEAITTLQLALNRIALSVDENSLSIWDGPRPEDIDDVAGDDGSFTRESVMELRTKAGDALSRRYSEVEGVILGRAALESLMKSTLATGTGGVVTAEGPPPSQVLGALARSGALRLDWAQAASAHVRAVLEAKEAQGPGPTARAAAATKGKRGTKAKKDGAKPKQGLKGKTAKKTKKSPSKRAPSKGSAKKALAKKTSTRAKKPAPKKKPVAKKR